MAIKKKNKNTNLKKGSKENQTKKSSAPKVKTTTNNKKPEKKVANNTAKTTNKSTNKTSKTTIKSPNKASKTNTAPKAPKNTKQGQKNKETKKVEKNIPAKKELKSTNKDKNKSPKKEDSKKIKVAQKLIEDEDLDIDDLDGSIINKNDASKKAIIFKKTDGKNKITFKVGDHAVYPSHGIGKIQDIEKINVAGEIHECYLIYFEKEKLTIKTPVKTVEKIGIRHLVSKEEMEEVFKVLRSGVKKLKGMWSRRAQEYETKINSGDIMLLAEVLRDLTRDIDDSERSYSERIIYETAISRLASEYAAIYGIDFEKAKEKVILTAKDKIDGEIKPTKKHDDDDFDNYDNEDDEDSDDDEDSEDEDEEMDDEEMDDMEDDYDDFDDE